MFIVLRTLVLICIQFVQFQTTNSSNSSKYVQSLICHPTSVFLPSGPSGSIVPETNHLNGTGILNFQEPMKILLWTKYYTIQVGWKNVLRHIINGQCPQDLNGNNCIFTFNRSEVDSSDGILFHLPSIPRTKAGNYDLPSISSQVRKNQIWIAMSYETPFTLYRQGFKDESSLNGVFNRTMSYRLDADIVVRHGNIHKLGQSESGRNSAQLQSCSKQERNYAAGKSKRVAWFSSTPDCKSQSKREVYISQLQLYIDVDIYGKCGPLKCGRGIKMTDEFGAENQACYDMVRKTYKFMVAMENSICADYVTEKMYNYLNFDVIPIVLGGVDYTIEAPPHSVIDASMYSPKQLAEYLQVLDKNDTLYNEYFGWKKDYYVIGNYGNISACDLCIKMNNQTWRTERKVYEMFDSWFAGNCSKGYGEV